LGGLWEMQFDRKYEKGGESSIKREEER
jgi:hypothetical protein